MNRRVVIGFVLMGIGLVISLALIIAAEMTIIEANECIDRGVINEPCYLIGQTTYLFFFVFGLGFPIAGISIVVSGLLKQRSFG